MTTSRLIAVGGRYAIAAWQEATEPHDLFRDRSFWPRRYAGLACAAVWIAVLTAARARPAGPSPT